MTYNNWQEYFIPYSNYTLNSERMASLSSMGKSFDLGFFRGDICQKLNVKFVKKGAAVVDEEVF